MQSKYSDYGTTYYSNSGVNSGVIQYVYYFILLIIILLLVLVVVNYTIYPVFRTKPGGKGFIPIPGSDDSKTFWKDGKNIGVIESVNTPLGSIHQNYSFMLNIQIDNPTANTGSPRILLTKGDELKSSILDNTDTILKINPNFNVCLYLDKLTNDLNITVQTVTSSSSNNQLPNIETITIPNLPVRKQVCLGVMVGNKLLEVYINGFLIRSKVFMGTLRDVAGPFRPPSDAILSTTARVGNLRIWNRPLSSYEFRIYSTTSIVNFSLKDLPDSSSCLSDFNKMIDSNISDFNKMIDSTTADFNKMIDSNTTSK